MKSKLILVILTVILGAAFALPSLAATNEVSYPSLRELIKTNANYEVINAVNGAIVNITSTNPNWIEKMHQKYDGLSKTSVIIAHNQIEIDLIKIDDGIQMLITVLHPAGANYQNLVEKVQSQANSPKPPFLFLVKTGTFLKNHFGWGL